MEIFDKDCLVRLGTCIAPRGVPDNETEELMEVELTMPEGNVRTENLNIGDILRIPLPTGEIAEAKITPNRRCDVGQGMGKAVTTKVEGGEAGIIIDARGRPLVFPDDKKAMRSLLMKWFTALNLYPKQALEKSIEEAD
jgi:hypothetical protein